MCDKNIITQEDGTLQSLPDLTDWPTGSAGNYSVPCKEGNVLAEP